MLICYRVALHGGGEVGKVRSCNYVVIIQEKLDTRIKLEVKPASNTTLKYTKSLPFITPKYRPVHQSCFVCKFQKLLFVSDWVS